MKIEISNNAKKFLKNSEKEDSTRLIKKIEELKEKPFSSDCKKVQGRKNIFRVRIGKIRILYVIFKEKDTLFVSKIDKRSKIYNN